ncbi:DUF928 domain-containing protein [Leptolyngbya sp. NIES-2104]|uniref:DUF928 domain-containing protein n=1 Tax=Leptolyngbya sp. NIES-2104 TaxID=1552121 RepID=UPI0006EC4BD5|nr:DUF928 domain-containing protein [Leptolyngbya sp. NIES-2104]GAP96232.1 hypothetical protein NIES2104_27670 [Leptolyngbya sp. NIES-2104]
MRWQNYSMLLIRIMLVSGFLMAGAANAFKPKVEPLRTGTSTSGVRGICQDRTVQDIAAIAPTTYTAQLTKDHPTLVWYIPEAYGSSMTLKLYRADNPNADNVTWQPVDEFPIADYKPGIYPFSLPPNLLVEGQVYAWQVELNCNPLNVSMNPRFVAEFKVVPSPVVSGKTAAEKAEFYADQGLWYSAYAEATIADQHGQKLRSQLLTALRDVESNLIQKNAATDRRSTPDEIALQVQTRRTQLDRLIDMTRSSNP